MYVDVEARTGNEDARRFLRVWSALRPSEQRTVVPEQVCELAQVSAADLVSWVTKQVWEENQSATSMVLSFNRPRVMAKAAEFAMSNPDNGRHMELFMKSAALLPQPGRGGAGPGISIYNMPTASSGSVALSGAKSESSPVSVSGLRDMDSEIVGISQIMQMNDAPLKSRAETLEDDLDADEDDDSDDDGEED